MAPSVLWRDPRLGISQACGLDIFLDQAPIEPVLAPVFDLDCPSGTYFSYLVGADPCGIAAVNSLSSRSGCMALLSLCEPNQFLVTGSHTRSLEVLRSKRADVACIDAVVWHILERDCPELLEGIDILARSSALTAPPYVMRRGLNHNVWITAMGQAFDCNSTRGARRALMLKGLQPVDRAEYADVWSEYESIQSRIPVHIEQLIEDRASAKGDV